MSHSRHDSKGLALLEVDSNGLPRHLKSNDQNSADIPGTHETTPEQTATSQAQQINCFNAAEGGKTSDPGHRASEDGGESIISRSSRDKRPGKLHRTLVEEIGKNSTSFHHGFLPRRTFAKVLSLRAVENELTKQDLSLAKAPSLHHLRFAPYSMTKSRRPVIEMAAKTIYGNSGQEGEPIKSRKSTRRSRNEKELKDGKSYLKIWAILLLMERSSKIRTFIDNDVCDADLPFELIETDGRCELRRSRSPATHLECFDGWNQPSIKEFDKYQWRFIVPCFSRPGFQNILHHCFTPKEILPFTFLGDDGRYGGSGWVRKVRIHPEHHDFRTCKTSKHIFAIKCFKPRNNVDIHEAFVREVVILKRVGNDKHHHIISVLGAYEQHQMYNLILPWAEHDLLSYWEFKTLGPKNKRKSLRWLAEQCEGIAGGLAYIHRYRTRYGKTLINPESIPHLGQSFLRAAEDSRDDEDVVIHLLGRHGDIKPDNILWFPHDRRSWKNNRGTLKIADFGIAEFRTETVPGEKDRERRGAVASTQPYRAPEIDFDDERIGPLYDIWSLGCVYLEFITWWFGGWALVRKFGTERLEPDKTWPVPEQTLFKVATFFSAQETAGKAAIEDVIVKPSVSQFIEMLKRKAELERDDFAFNFLRLIEQDMLVVRRSGCEGRKAAKTINEKLAFMRNKPES